MMELVFAGFFVGLLFGFAIGRSCEGNRWMDNAERIQRIEWRGRLFKVLPAGIYDWAVDQGAPIVPGENYAARID